VTGLDTNVLVRYIMQDDPAQSAKSTTLIESLDAANPGCVSLAKNKLHLTPIFPQKINFI